MDIKMKKDCIEADYFYAKHNGKTKEWFIEKATAHYFYDLDKLTTNEIAFFQGYITQLATVF
jgi:hypothetical protein